MERSQLDTLAGRRRRAACYLSGLVALLSLACQQPPVGWTPLLEQTSTRFLEAETESALESLENAEKSLTQDPVSSRDHLEEARLSLLRLRDYYLPLLRAREGAYNAYRWYHLGETDRVLSELASIESLVLELDQRRDAPLSRELESVLEDLVQAKSAVTADRADAPELIEKLGSHLNMLELKGGLALHGSDLGEE